MFDITIKDNWLYTLMIMQPDVITPEIFGEARQQIRKKKGDMPALAETRLADFEEGLCVQVMHLGPYATEPATIDRMREYMKQNGLKDNVGPDGKHHELYMSDPRRVAPEKVKTVLRHPVVKI
jgi:hypothetical protein